MFRAVADNHSTVPIASKTRKHQNCWQEICIGNGVSEHPSDYGASPVRLWITVHPSISQLLSYATDSLSRFKAMRPCLLAIVACSWPLRLIAQDTPTTPPPSAAYLLVIDHSGSMTTKMPSGQSRWQEMQAKATEFIRNVPLESRIWITVFTDKPPETIVPAFNTEADRQALINRIQNGYGNPDGGTALYDALGIAFEEAERLSRQHPGRNISVLAFTDGEDRDSKKWNPANLSRQFNQTVEANPNLFLFYVPIGNEASAVGDVVKSPNAREGAFNHVIAVSLIQSKVALKNPIVEPKQTIELEFAASDAFWEILKGTQLSFRFEPADKQAISVRAASVPFRKGRIPITLEVENAKQLKADQEYSGKLQITFPTFQKYVVQGRDFVQLTFQKGEKVEIYDVRPMDGAVFAAGKPVLFWANTLQGAKVLWEFGDGDSATGAETQHVYNTAGDRMVTVRAEADPRIGPTKRQFRLRIIDLGVSVDPVVGSVVEGKSRTFTATGRGPIERYEWVVDGQTFVGKPREDRQPGTEIAFSFSGPGPHVMSIVGYAEKAVVQAEERSLVVIEKPDVQIVQPQAGQVLNFGVTSRFAAVVHGPVRDVLWTIRTKADPKSPLKQIVRPVEKTDTDSVSKWEFAIPDADAALEIEVVAEGRLPSEIEMKAPTDEILASVEYPALAPTIEIEGAQPISFAQPTQFHLRGIGMYAVTWDFGDGQSDATNNFSPVHVYERTGAFRVGAMVGGRGGRTARAELDLNVVATPPVARPIVWCAGLRIGNEVRIHSTLELKDESEGGIVQRQWFLDGDPLPPNQLTVSLESLGRHVLRLLVKGPAGPNGDAPEDQKEVDFIVRGRLRYEIVGGAIVLAMLTWLLAWHLLTGNTPRKWKLYYAPGGEPSPEDAPRLNLADYWDRWRKHAVVPLRRMFPESPYWQTGDGSREVLTVHQNGAVAFSGEGELVTQLKSGEGTETRVEYAWNDRGCPEVDYRAIFIRLEKLRSDANWHIVVLIVLAVVLVLLVVWSRSFL